MGLGGKFEAVIPGTHRNVTLVEPQLRAIGQQHIFIHFHTFLYVIIHFHTFAIDITMALGWYLSSPKRPTID